MLVTVVYSVLWDGGVAWQAANANKLQKQMKAANDVDGASQVNEYHQVTR